MTRYLTLALSVFTLVVSSAFAEDTVAGTYLRNSKTCGGPGFADGKGGCDLVTEDALKIGAQSATGEYPVSFEFHYGYQDYCQYSGVGTKGKGELLLKTEIQGCQLKVRQKGSSAQIEDQSKQCAPALCTDSKAKLNGVTYKRSNG